MSASWLLACRGLEAPPSRLTSTFAFAISHPHTLKFIICLHPVPRFQQEAAGAVFAKLAISLSFGTRKAYPCSINVATRNDAWPDAKWAETTRARRGAYGCQRWLCFSLQCSDSTTIPCRLILGRADAAPFPSRLSRGRPRPHRRNTASHDATSQPGHPR